MSTEPIAPQEVSNRIRAGEQPYLLDVRRADDFEEWHIAGAENLPIYDELLDKNFEELSAAMGDLPDDREIIIVCVAGITSSYAAEFLSEHGYDARSMADGMRGWGRVYQAYAVEGVPGVTQVVRPGTGCVSYLVVDDGEALVVDPSIHAGLYQQLADQHDAEIVGALDTHAHADHISGSPGLAAELAVPYYLHDADSASLTNYEPITDGDAIPVGGLELDVLHTPGHTPGSISLATDGGLLTGDTLFIRGVGRPDLEDASDEAVREAAADLFDSLGVLKAYDDETLVLPGHFSDESMRPVAAELGDVTAENELAALDDREAFVERVVAGLSATPANYKEIKRINWGQKEPDRNAEHLELGPNNCAAN